MLCYVMLCYVMLCYVMLCYVVKSVVKFESRNEIKQEAPWTSSLPFVTSSPISRPPSLGQPSGTPPNSYMTQQTKLPAQTGEYATETLATDDRMLSTILKASI